LYVDPRPQRNRTRVREPTGEVPAKTALAGVANASWGTRVSKTLERFRLSVCERLADAVLLARTQAFHVYIVQTPLACGSAAEACRGLRRLDANAPLLLYSARPSDQERAEALRLGANAYLAWLDDPYNLGGMAAQLAMLSELQSAAAAHRAGPAIQDRLVRQLLKIGSSSDRDPSVLLEEAQERLKRHASRTFALAGGTRAHFERVWPSLYAGALERLTAV
jgi:DNA-binding NarL/FixJ family response regulator